MRKGGTLGFLAEGDDAEEVKASQEKIEKALKEAFRPEFLNRVDDIITFAPLTKEDVVKIVDLEMAEIIERVEEYGVHMVVDESARLWLADQGYDPLFGARPLKRALQKYVESKLAIKLLEGEFKQGDVVHVCKEEEHAELTFYAEETEIDPEASQPGDEGTVSNDPEG